MTTGLVDEDGWKEGGSEDGWLKWGLEGGWMEIVLREVGESVDIHEFTVVGCRTQCM